MATQASNPTPDQYKSKRHKFYADDWLVDGLDALAEINKKEGRKCTTRSQILANAAAKLLRLNANRLREAGHKLPESLFSEK